MKYLLLLLCSSSALAAKVSYEIKYANGETKRFPFQETQPISLPGSGWDCLAIETRHPTKTKTTVGAVLQCTPTGTKKKATASVQCNARQSTFLVLATEVPNGENAWSIELKCEP